jgi:hypothetical protein
MAKHEDNAEARATRLAVLRSGIEEADRRKKAEGAQHKRVGDGRALRQTGRVDLFNFRAHPQLRDACKAAAEAKGMKLAEWMEFHLVAALEAEERDTSFLSNIGARS